MSHISLYRKYRPASFEEVVGQEHVTRTLKNAIESGKISHAYLFAGSRGTGKTSTAKLLAKALNCADGPTASPCGKCESCTSISAGTSLDVIEMDAASNRGIDDIRDIRDKVAFSPVEGKSRVYILDEAHMLTKEASNAFLKVLEEPPAHVFFVLCTTEAHKVLPTIQSRCQRFEFRRPDVNMVLEVLKRIAAAEKIDIDAGGLTAIARSASGSFRDAVGVLDQLSTYCDGQVSLSDVLSMLGTVESDLLFEAVDIIAASDARGAILFVNRLAERGRDFSQFAGELISHLRNIFLLQQLDDHPAGIINAPEEDLSLLRGQSRLLAPAQVLRFVDLLTKARSAMKQGSDPRLQLELAFFVMARPEVDLSIRSLLYRIEQLEAGTASAKSPPLSVERPDTGKEAAPADKPAGAPEKKSVAGGENGEKAKAKVPEITLDKVKRAWSVILAQVKKQKIPLYSLLQEGKPVELGGGALIIGFPPEAEFHKTQVEKPQYTAIISGVLREITGVDLRVECAVTEGAAAAVREKKAPSAEEVIALIKEELGAEEMQ